MRKQVLFIQGAGEGAYEEDKKLAASLQNVLGTDYQVSYPPMPDEADPKDDASDIAFVPDRACAVTNHVCVNF